MIIIFKFGRTVYFHLKPYKILVPLFIEVNLKTCIPKEIFVFNYDKYDRDLGRDLLR